MQLIVTGGLISWTVNLAIGFFIYFNNPKRKVNRITAFFNICIGSWSLGSFLLNIIPDKDIGLWILRLSYVFAALLVPTFLRLVYVLVEQDINIKIYNFSWLFALTLILALPTRLFINGLNILSNDGLLISSPGPVFYFFVVGFVVAAGFGF